MRVAQKALVACLISLPAVAFANVYPLSPPPDVFIDTIASTGNALSGYTETGIAEVITDYGNCSIVPCTAYLDFTENSSGFEITDASNNIYLAGTLVPLSTEIQGDEVGQEFSITTDNSSLWSTIEGGQTPTSFGPGVYLDFNDFYFGDAGFDSTNSTADLAPVPEPASLTLLLSGLAAGYVKKRRAAKKA